MDRLETTTKLLAALAMAASLWACDDKAASPPGASPGAKAEAAPTSKATGAAATAPAPGPVGDTPAKTYDCGAKDQKPCPMQGWMKRVMAPASAAGEPDGLMKALGYVADHAPPGFPEWTVIAGTGASKAKAGDVDGARNSCKQCHDAYKDKYKTTMRDRPF